jgi:protein-S-isoprenylcysteine O-methyltransferase Ste14
MKSHQVQNLVPLIFTLTSIFIIYNFCRYCWYNYVGIVFMVIGLILWWWGKIKLGNSFSTFPKAKKLVTVGIYSKIRHPVYIGLCLTLIGWAIFTLSWFLGIITLIVVVISIIRAYLENQVLEKTFKKEYVQYKKKVWV